MVRLFVGSSLVLLVAAGLARAQAATVEELEKRLEALEKQQDDNTFKLYWKEGVRFDKRDPLCLPCHQENPRPWTRAVRSLDENRGAVFRISTVFPNGPSCRECHASKNMINGVMIAESPIARYAEALTQDYRIMMICLLASLGGCC